MLKLADTSLILNNPSPSNVNEINQGLKHVKISYLCLSVEMAGSNTKGTRKRKAKTLTIQAVPRNKDV